MSTNLRKQMFGKNAKGYQKFRLPYPQKLYKELFSWLDPKSQIHVLDLGCGTGKSTEPLLTTAPRAFKKRLIVTGCDPDIHMLKEARISAKKNKLRILYVQGSAERLPFLRASFNAVVVGTAFHWFATRKALRDIHRVLKPGGILFVFWTEIPKNKVKRNVIGHDIFKKYHWKGIPRRSQDLSKNKALFESARFVDFRTEVFPFTEKKTVKDVIGWYTTHSSFALLSSLQQKDFIKRLKEAYAEALGPKTRITSRRLMRINYAVKK